VSDHQHYEYASDRHDHRGEYAEARHDHDGDYAEERHRHYDLENDDQAAALEIRGLRDDLLDAERRIGELENDLRDALERIRALEGQTPRAQQIQLEADQAMADLAESGYDRHGRDCQCSYCATDEDWPQERGVSEYNREEFALDRGEEPRS
jgi:hypothetical protein